MSTPAAPSLVGGAQAPRPLEPARAGKNLVDLMYDGFYLLFLIRQRHAPSDAAAFTERIRTFLDEFERNARRLNTSADDIYAAKYAFCAAVDELILTSGFSIREAWERQPLQLTFFGQHLAGEGFFTLLETHRAQGAARLPSLEVFHLCLLLGFRGKYMMDGPEKLTYLTARLGDEIAHHKGQRAGFAPHWQAPDNVRHTLNAEIPVWVFVSAFALLGLLGFVGMRARLAQHTEQQLSGYSEIVKLAPRAANLTITLP